MLLLIHLRFLITHDMCLTFFSCLGKYQSGVDKPDPKTWKANFRCAMNSLPDIEEVKDKSIKKGNNAFRVYRMLPLSERPSKKGRGENSSMWKWCWGRCYYFEACKMCQFYFSWCEAGCFYPDVPQNTGVAFSEDYKLLGERITEMGYSQAWWSVKIVLDLLKLIELCSDPHLRCLACLSSEDVSDSCQMAKIWYGTVVQHK